MPERDAELLETTVRAAGAIAREYAERGFQTMHKTDGSPVTEADLAVNKYLLEHLRAARPGYAWLSEETEDDHSRFAASRVFVVDPIDGTLAFVRRKPHFTICAAVVENERPIAAAVYNPMTDESFAATAGKGATLNGKPIRVSGHTTLDGCNMLASRSTLSHPRWAAWPQMHIENPNSIALRLAWVADGRFDAAMTMAELHDWDLAAADLILAEAGGVLTSVEGEAPRYNRKDVIQPSALAAGPQIHALLRARLSPAKETS